MSEETWEKTLAIVRRVPRGHRRIIITVHLHPHENTLRLIESLDPELLRATGTLVVKIPYSNTPNGIWEDQARRFESPRPIPVDVHADEDEFERWLAVDDRPYFIRFHGSDIRDGSARRCLDVACRGPGYAAEDDGHTDPRVAVLSRLVADCNATELNYPAGTICLEYYYVGAPAPLPTNFIKQALALGRQRGPSGVPLIYAAGTRGWWRKGNIAPVYLTHPVLTDEDADWFEKAGPRALLEFVLRYLARSVS